MEIYIVFRETPYSSDEIMSAHFSKPGADKEARELYLSEQDPKADYKIVEKELQQ